MFCITDTAFDSTIFYSEKACSLAFEEDMGSLKWKVCGKCKEKRFASKLLQKTQCTHRNKCWEYSSLNDMDPGEVPEELKGLTFIEEQVIARVHPMIMVYKLKGHQYGYKGNVICFSQDVQQFATTLPHKISDLNSIVCIKYKGLSDKYHEFQIRSERVKRALKWLKKFNPHYKNITISEENLNSLPHDGNVSDQIESMCVPQDESNSDPVIENENDPDDDTVIETGVPLTQPLHQDELVRQKLNWPTMSNEPINEMRTPGYIVCAFPTLFPYGIGDLRDNRMKEVKPGNYFKHFMNFHDDRFAKHPTFRFFAYNSWIRWTALSDGSVFVKNNVEFKNLTVSELKEKLSENQNIMRQIMFQSSNLRGTKAYWHTRANELRDMVEQLGLPTIFLTLSCADGHWNDLYKLLSPDKEVSLLTEKERRQLIQDNPHVVDSFFDYRVKSFIKNVSCEPSKLFLQNVNI